MDIAGWRRKIDELDRKLVELLNERARAAPGIGRFKRNTNMASYWPAREKKIFESVREWNKGPLPDSELQHIFERVIDVMRNLQKNEMLAEQAQKKAAESGETEFDIEVN